MAKKQPKKYIFIDTNVYYSFFSESEVFSDDFLQYMQKLITVADTALILPKQVKDEIERNSIGKWYLDKANSLRNKLDNLDKLIGELELKFGQYSKKAVNKIKSDIQKKRKEIVKNIESSKKQFLSPTSASRVKLNKLLKLATDIEESDIIRNNAFFRREKDNPPNDGNKLGDKLIWESLLNFLSARKKEKPTLIFIAKDNTAWRSKVKDNLEFNSWLQKEYKLRTNGKVILIDSISKIPGLTPAEQQKIKEEEEKENQRNITLKLKTNIPERMKVVNTFSDAEKLMRIIEPRLDFIDSDGVEQILKASIDNVSYSLGPFNQVLGSGYAPTFFYKLLQVSIKLGLDLKSWKDFYSLLDESEQESFYNIRKTLEEKGITFSVSELKYMPSEELKDLPF